MTEVLYKTHDLSRKRRKDRYVAVKRFTTKISRRTPCKIFVRPRSPRFGRIAPLNNASGAANVELFAGYAQREGTAGLQIVNIDT